MTQFSPEAATHKVSIHGIRETTGITLYILKDHCSLVVTLEKTEKRNLTDSYRLT